jgi:hypothetical protein
MEAERLITFVVVEGGKAVVAVLNTFVGDEETFDSTEVVFHDNGIAVVDSGCRFVFAALPVLAD